jgi:protein AaeX
MRYTEINIFGIYVSPFVPMMLAAWLAVLPLHRAAHRLANAGHVWHPALFNMALYVIVLSIIVLIVGWV